jgi:hypothetical protein
VRFLKGELERMWKEAVVASMADAKIIRREFFLYLMDIENFNWKFKDI